MDYKKLGLVAGIECHQQLNTKKLFCNCESKLTEEKGDFEVNRKLRPVASESGGFDSAAMQEYKKGKYNIYEGITKDICLVELDEEPPHSINKDALRTVFEIARLTHANIFDRAFIMRKIVIDGSNTSGFQRTSLIAQNGFLDIDGKRVGIDSICLEEDACKNLSSEKEFTKYKLDRLGIPLIEFTTKPDLNTPTEVKECAKKIGEMFRITGKAKRGLGTIRQDVNVSIRGGTRIEIKGVQYLDLIDKYVENEVKRQLGLIEIKDKLKQIDNKDKQKFEVYDITNIMSKCENKRVLSAISNKKIARAIILKNFKGILGFEIQDGRRVGTELASYAKAKSKVQGMFHSDELPKYNISEKIVKEIYSTLKLGDNDAFAIVVEDDINTTLALKAIFDRALKLYDEIPPETRNPLEDGTTEYSRPLAGSERMYPETDVPIISINNSELKEIDKTLPRWYNERVELYINSGLNKQMATYIAKSNYAREFTKRIKKYNILKLAEFVSLLPQEIKFEDYEWILSSKIDRNDYKKAINKFTTLKNKEKVISLFEKTGLNENMKTVIDKVISDKKDLIDSRGEGALNPLMGFAMKEIVSKTGQKPDMRELSAYLKNKIK